MFHLPPVILQVIWLKGRDPHTSQAHTTAQMALCLLSMTLRKSCPAVADAVSSGYFLSGMFRVFSSGLCSWRNVPLERGCRKAGQGHRWREPGGDPTYRVLVDDTRPQLLEGRLDAGQRM